MQEGARSCGAENAPKNFWLHFGWPGASTRSAMSRRTTGQAVSEKSALRSLLPGMENSPFDRARTILPAPKHQAEQSRKRAIQGMRTALLRKSDEVERAGRWVLTRKPLSTNCLHNQFIRDGHANRLPRLELIQILDPMAEGHGALLPVSIFKCQAAFL